MESINNDTNKQVESLLPLNKPEVETPVEFVELRGFTSDEDKEGIGLASVPDYNTLLRVESQATQVGDFLFGGKFKQVAYVAHGEDGQARYVSFDKAQAALKANDDKNAEKWEKDGERDRTAARKEEIATELAELEEEKRRVEDRMKALRVELTELRVKESRVKNPVRNYSFPYPSEQIRSITEPQDQRMAEEIRVRREKEEEERRQREAA